MQFTRSFRCSCQAQSSKDVRAPSLAVAAHAVKPRAVHAQQQQQQQHDEAAVASRRQLVGMLLGMGSLAALVPQPQRAEAVESTDFLRSAVERTQQKEGEVVRALEEDLLLFEQEADRSKEGKFCATPFGVDVVGITQAMALVGALVGGVVARQRKDEVERLNEQLRKINLQLTKKLKVAPGNPTMPSDTKLLLRSVPSASGSISRPAAATDGSPSLATTVGSTYLSMEEEEMSPDQLACREALRAGKRLLRDKNGSAAMVRFEKALMLSKALTDKVQERRANRGLAAAARLQKQFRTAIVHLERVLEISNDISEFSGMPDVYGVIADCYTDLDEFDQAAKYYDKYIAAMDSDTLVLA